MATTSAGHNHEPPQFSRRPPGLGLLFGAVVRPIVVFTRLEAASGILLFLAALAALVWANSAWAESYTRLFGAPITLAVGSFNASFNVLQLINDGLMTMFFYVVGMEIKRELVVGELREFRAAVLPAIAAAGGMIIPASIFYAINAGRPGAHGWGIPVATDIAFCIGCLTLLKNRVGHGLVVFLTALAIFDDIGGILIIAIFYGHGLHAGWLALAAVVALIVISAGRSQQKNGMVYFVLGCLLWYALHAGGIHATIAGVIVGLATPAGAARPSNEVLQELGAHTQKLLSSPRNKDLEDAELLAIEEKLEDLEPPLNRFIHIWHPYVAFGIMPLFALANSGVSLSGFSFGALLDRTTLGILLGLFVGKQLGVFAATWAAVRAGFSKAPAGASWIKIWGVAVLSGIGFTVALFIGTLAYPGQPALLDQAKVGILAGSLLSGVLGCMVLRLSPRVTASKS